MQCAACSVNVQRRDESVLSRHSRLLTLKSMIDDTGAATVTVTVPATVTNCQIASLWFPSILMMPGKGLAAFGFYIPQRGSSTPPSAQEDVAAAASQVLKKLVAVHADPRVTGEGSFLSFLKMCLPPPNRASKPTTAQPPKPAYRLPPTGTQDPKLSQHCCIVLIHSATCTVMSWHVVPHALYCSVQMYSPNVCS